MKALVLTLAMTLSAQVLASASTLLMSESSVKKESIILVKEIQEYSMTGVISITLKQKISDALIANPDLSVEEAIEVIFETESQKI